MVAFTYRMPAGIPGDINRVSAATVEPHIITPTGTTGAPLAYGIPVNVDATTGLIRSVAASETTVYGLLARPFPTGGSQDPLGTSTPPANGQCDVLVRGYMTVLLSGATAAVKGGQVWVWATTTTTAHTLGSFEAASASGMISLGSNTYFMGPADPAGNIEVAFNI